MSLSDTSVRRTALSEKVYAAEADRQKRLAEIRELEKFKQENEEPIAPPILMPANRVRIIQASVARAYNISVNDMLSQRRPVEIVEARMVAMWIAYKHTTYSLPQVGASFKRDHTTVLHAVRKIEAQMRHDTDFKFCVDALVIKILGEPREFVYWGA